MRTIHTNDIENTYVAAIPFENSYNGTNAPLKYLLNDLVEEWKERLTSCKSLEYHSNEQKGAKSRLPRFYISGAYDFSVTDRFPIYNKPIKKSNLMTIDVDEQDNNIDIWKIRDEIFNLPYVYSCLKSVSGHGFYVIIPILDTDFTKEYYNYICDLWKQKYGIVCDKQASSLVRARIISYDEDSQKYIKKDTEINVWELKKKQKKECIEEYKQEVFSKYETTTRNFDKLIPKIMEALINDGYCVNSYGAWWYIGCELANFDNGEQLFIKLSQNNTKYNDSIKTILNKWKQCSPTGITDELRRKWMGMAKNKYGEQWMAKIQENKLV